MAYLLPIVRPKCAHIGCRRWATKRVMDRWNYERNAFCERHATAAMERQSRTEAFNDGKVAD